LVRWNNPWKLSLFDESPVEMALKGSDGWLYWAQDGMIDDYTGTTRFDEQDLNAWQKLLEARRDWLVARNEKYIFVIAPDKHSIYPEYLPDWLKKGGKPSKLDQFLAHMRAHSTVEILDLRPALIAAKEDGPTYLQTDTHWNNFGAFVAYQQLVRSLQRQMPGLQPLPLEAFDRKHIVERGGDLSICLDQQDDFLETNEVLFAPRPPLLQLTEISCGPNKEQAGTGIIITTNSAAVRKVVVFRDSFGEKWMPFLGLNFLEVIYLRQVEWNKFLLEREKPDVVIDEMVERLFNSRDPQQLLKLDK
jgi:alginate O-acetyltransferase complex protein AlgJ